MPLSLFAPSLFSSRPPQRARALRSLPYRPCAGVSCHSRFFNGFFLAPRVLHGIPLMNRGLNRNVQFGVRHMICRGRSHRTFMHPGLLLLECVPCRVSTGGKARQSVRSVARPSAVTITTFLVPNLECGQVSTHRIRALEEWRPVEAE